MSQQEHLQTVKLIREALLRGDLPALLKFCTDDLEILPAASEKVPWAHPWRGRNEVEQYFKMLASEIEFQEYETDEFIAATLGKKPDHSLASAADALRAIKLVDACYRLPSAPPALRVG